MSNAEHRDRNSYRGRGYDPKSEDAFKSCLSRAGKFSTKNQNDYVRNRVLFTLGSSAERGARRPLAWRRRGFDPGRRQPLWFSEEFFFNFFREQLTRTMKEKNLRRVGGLFPMRLVYLASLKQVVGTSVQLYEKLVKVFARMV